ncbi:hypothetical protein DVV95_04665 [Clostridium botulinum]|nr:hypothetical protein [Clostridium botulinum]MBN1057866.1 hypothetical protein [Clostridium botulinum]MBN1061111.1 hypothetical protein [Clostridium botulinum]
MNNDEVFNLRDKENKREVLKGKLEKLIDSFLSSSGTMQSIVEKKIKELETQINRLENEIVDSKSKNSNQDKFIRDTNNKINKLKEELNISSNKELTRAEWLDRIEMILIERKESFKSIYNLD